MNEPVRLHDLSDTQLGALLLAWHGRLRWTAKGWRPDGSLILISRQTFDAMTRMGLFRLRVVLGGNGKQRYGDLTLAGYALADIAITLSREIAAGVAGLPQRLPIEAKAAAEEFPPPRALSPGLAEGERISPASPPRDLHHDAVRVREGQTSEVGASLTTAGAKR